MPCTSFDSVPKCWHSCHNNPLDSNRLGFGLLLLNAIQSSRPSGSPLQHSPDPNDGAEWPVQQIQRNGLVDPVAAVYLTFPVRFSAADGKLIWKLSFWQLHFWKIWLSLGFRIYSELRWEPYRIGWNYCLFLYCQLFVPQVQHWQIIGLIWFCLGQYFDYFQVH